MHVRSLVALASLVASMALPSLAGAQVQVRAGIRIGTPAPPTVVVVQQPAQPVYVVQPPPQVQPVYVRRGRRGRAVIVHTPHGVYIDRRHGRRGHRHR